MWSQRKKPSKPAASASAASVASSRGSASSSKGATKSARRAVGMAPNLAGEEAAHGVAGGGAGAARQHRVSGAADDDQARVVHPRRLQPRPLQRGGEVVVADQQERGCRDPGAPVGGGWRGRRRPGATGDEEALRERGRHGERRGGGGTHAL